MTFNWIVLSKQLFLQGATFLKRLCVHSKEAVMFLSPVCKAAHVEVHYINETIQCIVYMLKLNIQMFVFQVLAKNVHR